MSDRATLKAIKAELNSDTDEWGEQCDRIEKLVNTALDTSALELSEVTPRDLIGIPPLTPAEPSLIVDCQHQWYKLFDGSGAESCSFCEATRTSEPATEPAGAHTAGPWTARGHLVVTTDHDIGIAKTFHNIGQPAAANAKFIADAPAIAQQCNQLLEAAKLAILKKRSKSQDLYLPSEAQNALEDAIKNAEASR